MTKTDGLLKFDHPKEKSSIIKVLGVGGGGSNAVNHMFKQGIHGVDFIVCNTDAQAIDMSPVSVKIQLGSSLTAGNGAGSKPEVGKNAAIENIEDIREVLERETKMVFITAGMGGGTGTGAAPVIAKLAKEMEILTIGIVTIPFSFEGRKRRQLAENGVNELRQHVDTLLVINNDKLRELHGNLQLWEAFAKADNILTEAAKGIAEIITQVGYINVDFEDVNTVMKDSGVAIMGTGIASGEDRAMTAVEEALNSPLLNDSQIRGASNVLLYIASGAKGIRLDEVTEITDYIQNEAGSEAEIIWGNGEDESLEENIAVTIIATGFQTNTSYDPDKIETKRDSVIVGNLDENKQKHLSDPEKEKHFDDIKMIKKENTSENDKFYGITSDEKDNEDNENHDNSGNAPDEQNAASENKRKKESSILIQNSDSPDENKHSTQTTTKEKPNTIDLQQQRIHRLREQSLKIKSQDGLIELESYPAYKRRGMDLPEPKHSSESEVSKYSLGDSDEPSLNSNSFLHSETD